MPVNPQKSPAEAASLPLTVENTKAAMAPTPEAKVAEPSDASALPTPMQPPVGAQPSTQVPTAAQSADDAASSTPMPQIADDVDLIEKEWVEKAKSIIEKTKHDPKEQNEQIGKIKAEYLKKRFNREPGVVKGQ